MAFLVPIILDKKSYLIVRKSILLILGVITTSLVPAQSLIKNGSFEEKAYCPANFNQSSLNILTHWRQPTQGTPDYFHECSGKAGVPNNVFGKQPAYEGQGYAGLVTFTSGKYNYREYLQIKLDRPLTAGEIVCVEAQLSPADMSLYVTDGFGMFFSTRKLHQGDQKAIRRAPQMENPSLHLINDHGFWTKISDTFVAEGGEEWLTLGNFKYDSDLTILRRTREDGAVDSNNWAYLYIDDLKVKRVDKREDCSCVNDLIKETVHDPPLELGEVREIDISSILFEFDKDIITADSKEELKSVIKLMKRRDVAFMEVIGHTDIVGADGYNFDLSKRRAQAVIDYMAEQGTDPDRLQISWRGANVPVANNDSDLGRAQNRRVEFRILEYKYELYEVPERKGG